MHSPISVSILSTGLEKAFEFLLGESSSLLENNLSANPPMVIPAFTFESKF